jgi:hypothetical protein
MSVYRIILDNGQDIHAMGENGNHAFESYTMGELLAGRAPGVARIIEFVSEVR